MSKKAGNILLPVFAILVMLGAVPQTQAKPQIEIVPGQTSTCSSALVSTQQCIQLMASACIGQPIKPIQPQVAGAVAIADSKDTEGSPVKTELVVATLEPTISVSEKEETSPTPVYPAGYAPDGTLLDSNLIFDLINQYRANLGLAAFEKENTVCSLAETRATEIIEEIGGRAGYLHSGLYNRGLSYWIWENAKYGSDEAGTVAWWKSSSVHHQSIVGDYKYSCVKCNGTYCVQLFTNFELKQSNSNKEL